jgi:uncharacterized metal-binding protein
VIVKPLPVLYACPGCASDGLTARRVAMALDQLGLAESCCIPAAGGDFTCESRARSRYPVIAVDGCPEACTLRWLEGIGVTPQRRYVTTDFSLLEAEQIAQRLAAEW